MATNNHHQSTLGKFSELLFVRQTPQVGAEQHKTLRAAFAQWRGRRAAKAELSGMSDRDLADIGLSRHDIPAVVKHGR